jgi:glycosyltransferase involved in cell wall biosynthesis
LTLSDTGSSATAKELLFVVPVFNERESLPAVIGDLRSAFPESTVLVVDDGSTDDSAAIARGLGVEILQLPFNLGIGVAVQTGFRFAAARGVRYTVQFDGDGQHRADQVEALLSPLARDECDVVIGSRFLGSGRYAGSLPRRLGISVFRFVNGLLLRRTVRDSTSGFRAYNRAALRFVAEEYSHDYPEPESVVSLVKAGFRVSEAPVLMRKRQGGRSSITFWRSIYYMAKVLLAIAIGATRQTRRPPR